MPAHSVPRVPASTSQWKLEDAKARFSELVRRAQAGSPQHVTVHGRAAVVVVSAADYARLSPAAASPSLAALIARSPLSRMEDFEDVQVREPARHRELPHFDE